MQAILIDNIDSRFQLASTFSRADWIAVSPDATEISLAQAANEVVCVQDVVLIVNLNLWTDTAGPLSQAGATILEFVRFTETYPNGKRNNLRYVHCVLFSTHSFERAIRNRPEQAIIYCQGTSFIGSIGQKQLYLDGKTLSRRSFNASDWRKTTKQGTVVETDNHSIANWWGVQKLSDAHFAVTGKRVRIDEISPELSKIENLRTLALYRSDGDNSSSASRDAEEADVIRQLREEVLKRDQRLLHIDDDWEKGWTRMFAYVMLGDDIDCLDQGGLLRIYHKRGSESAIAVLKNFPVFKLTEAESFAGNLVQKVRQVIAAWNPTCIFLDLRLGGDEETGADVERLSGVQFLQYLRRDLKGIPVIVTTASNKAQSIAKLLQSGADAFWTKDRMDATATQNDSIANYARLLNLLHRATGQRYRFLAKFASAVEKHTSAPMRWYSSGSWKIGQQNQSRVDEILKDSVSLLRTFLHSSVMQYEYRSARDERHIIANLVTYSFHAIEIIHNPGNLVRNPTTSVPFSLSISMNRHGHHLGNWLRRMRNDYAHLSFLFGDPAHIATFDCLERFLIALIAYLEVDPAGCEPFGPREDLRTISHYKHSIDGHFG